MRPLVGIHAVLAAVRARPSGKRRIDRVLVARGARNPRLRAVVEASRKLGIPVRAEPRAALARIAGTASHQDVVAISSSGSFRPLERVISAIEGPSTIVVLDSVQDPRNLGAVIRTADGAGATAVMIPERRSAGLGAAAAKAAAGAIETVPVVRAKNLSRALERLKREGFWIYGLDAGAETDYDAVEYADRCALLMGGEERGMRLKVAQRCDFLVRIPLAGSVESLNVSVAAGIALFEVSRQRRAGTT